MPLSRRLPAAALLAFFALPALAHSADGDLLTRSGCTFPPYGKAAGIEKYATPGEYNHAVTDQHFSCERLQYASNGIPVVAFLYHPAGSHRPLPLIIFNRGSWVVNDQLPLLVARFHRLAEAGFTVIAPMYRGSEGAPGHDELGGADLADLVNVLPVARNLGLADIRNVFLYGESRGGVMALLALRDGFPARAAATFGAFTDLAACLETDPRAQQAANTIWPDFADRQEAILRSRSIIRSVDRIHTPLLIMHGAADRQVNPQQSFNLAARLEELGKPYRLSLFGGDSHLISEHRLERDQQAVLWFQHYLP